MISAFHIHPVRHASSRIGDFRMKIASGNDRVHFFWCGVINVLVTNFQTGAVSQRPMQTHGRHHCDGSSRLHFFLQLFGPC